MMSINDLSEELLSKIFHHCPRSKETTKILGSVCRKWTKVVDKSHGVFLAEGVGQSSGPKVQEVKNKSRKEVVKWCLDSLKKNGMATPFLLTSPIDGSKPQEYGDTNGPPPPILEYNLEQQLKISPGYLRKLCVVGTIPLNFVSLLRNLSGLHIHLTTINGLTNTCLKLDLPLLKTLVLDSSGMKECWEKGLDVPQLLEWERIFSVKTSLLNQNTFPSLQTLIVDVPFCEEREKAVVTTLTSTLKRHINTIQSFCYHQGFCVGIPREDSDKEDEHGEGDEDERSTFSLGTLAKSLMDLRQVTLKDLHIGLCTPQESSPIWKNFLLQQRTLEKVIITGDRIPFPATTLKLNCSTLTTVTLELRDSIDLAYLKDCKNLKKISLIGTTQESLQQDYGVNFDESDEGSELEFLSRDILNLNMLPKTLEVLRISRLKIQRKVIHDILTSGEWKELKDVELVECGVEGNSGVSLKTIGVIMEQKFLKSFVINFSLNRKSVSEKDIPTSLRMLAYSIKCNSTSNFMIHGWLNARGEYDPFPPEEECKVQEPDLFTFPEEISRRGTEQPEFGHISKSESSESTESDSSESETSSSSCNENSNSTSSGEEDEDESEEKVSSGRNE